MSNFLHSTMNRKINWRFYDTSKPIDSKTGKHPLLAEGDTEENNKIEQETNVISADSFLCNPIAHHLPGVRKR